MSTRTNGSLKIGDGIWGFSTDFFKNSLDRRQRLGSQTCKENLENSFVIWYYKAMVSCDKDQESFYKKLLEGTGMSDVDISALITEGAHLNNRQFDSDRRTRTHAMAPEPVQQLLNKLLSIWLDNDFVSIIHCICY